MSVLVTLKVAGDTGAFRDFIASSEDVLVDISEDAKAHGAIHHRFAIGDGFVLVVDEWETADSFTNWFMGNEAVGKVMMESGAQGEPEVTIAEAVASADSF